MDWTKPTTQMLGRFQPWHKGHTELFKRSIEKTGQVIILLRNQDGTENDPFNFDQRCQKIILELMKSGYYDGEHFSIIPVPNITHISYGRDVGYKIEQESFDKEIEEISSSDIRKTDGI